MFWILSGNGTLNKQAGIDYKQLSLLAKINENQSGEVSTCCQAIIVLFFLFLKSALLFHWLAVLYPVMARSMAGRRDNSEGAAGEGLDHQEEQRLQWGAPETQVILMRPFSDCFGWWRLQNLCFSFSTVTIVYRCRLKILKTSPIFAKQSHNRKKIREANLNTDFWHCES